MTKLLHIISTPRPGSSNTLAISQAFIDSLKKENADLEVEEIDLFTANLPAVAGDNIETKYTLMVGQPVTKENAESWKNIETEIERFLGADMIVISAPMWNFSIPYTLKYYIDSIVQPGYLFKYNEQGVPMGLVAGKKMVVVTSTGGDYSADGPMAALNFVEPYLRTIFGFCGITDMEFILAGPMDYTAEVRQGVIAGGIATATALAASMS